MPLAQCLTITKMRLIEHVSNRVLSEVIVKISVHRIVPPVLQATMINVYPVMRVTTTQKMTNSA